MSKKILFISGELIAADIAYGLVREGNEVKLYIETESDRDCFDGMVPKTDNWQAELDWVGKDGLIVFDDVGYGHMQDELRSQGFTVFGGSAEGDRLERDRQYGQAILKTCGVLDDTAFETHDFVSVIDAKSFILKNKGTWVLKQEQHASFQTYIGVLKSGADMIDILEKHAGDFGPNTPVSLQKKIEGIEIAIGRFFNGVEWVGPLVINKEHKHFMNHNIGPLGGESGTIMWYDSNEKTKLFQMTLAKLTDHLRAHNHIGYVDLNCIINGEQSLYPLEFTCRFGSSTNQLQSEIQISPWGEFLYALASKNKYDLQFKQGYGVAVALTVPPYPYKTSDTTLTQKGVGIFFDDTLNETEQEHIHYEDVSQTTNEYGSRLQVAGNSGYVLYVTHVAKSIKFARQEVYKIIQKIHIPKMFFRTDIGETFEQHEQKTLQKWKWI